MKQLKVIVVLLCSLILTTTFSHDVVFFNNIAMCRYYLQRLTQSVSFLTLLDQQQYHYKPCNIMTQTHCIQIDSTHFFHQKIKQCIRAMVRSASLNPLLLLLKEIKKYQHIHDQHLIHELILLIFTIHKQIIFRECEATEHIPKTITLNDIIILSEKINQLPIGEVLNAIDMLVTELPPFLEKYEFNSAISWKAWLKKYWWVPPIFGAWFALKVLLRLQKPQFYFSAYNTPKPPINLPPFITNDPALQEIAVL